MEKESLEASQCLLQRVKKRSKERERESERAREGMTVWLDDEDEENG